MQRSVELVAVLFLAACGSEGSSSPPAASVSLLDHLDQATVQRPWTETAPTSLLRESLAGDKDSQWFEGAWELALERGQEAPLRAHARTVTDPDSGAPVLGLARPSLGLSRLLIADEGPVVLRVRARRVDGTAPLEAALLVENLRKEPPTRLDPTHPVPWGLREPRRWDLPGLRKDLVFPAAEEDGWQDFLLPVPHARQRRGLCVSLVVTQGALLLQDFEVLRPTMVDHVRTESEREQQAPPSLQGRDLVLTTSARTLRLAQGWEVSWPVRIPEMGARLDTLLGHPPVSRAFQATVRLQVGEDLVEERSVHGIQAADGAFQPWVVDLSAYAGQEVDLRLSMASAEPGALVLLGAPWILGADPEQRPNVLWISLDTLRADHVGPQADGTTLTPGLDQRVRRGARFTDMVSPSSYTLPAHVTMMTGQSPVTHGVTRPPRRIHPTATRVVAELAREAGYRTAAFTGGGFLHPLFGFQRGFDQFHMQDPAGVESRYGPWEEQDPALGQGSVPDMQVSLAPTLDWLDRHADQPFFLFVHSFFVHNYTADPRYLAEVDPAVRLLGREEKEELHRRAEQDGDREAARQLAELYRATVRQVDEVFLPALFERLESLGVADRTVVMLVSDHGEEFLEHDKLGHGHAPWETQVRVPWLAWGPGVPAGENAMPASLEDVAPTLLGLLGLAPDPAMQGDDLLDEDAQPRQFRLFQVEVILNQSGPWEGGSLGPYKLLRDWTGADGRDGEPLLHLYHLGEDPGETLDLADQQDSVVVSLNGMLEQRLEALARLAQEMEDLSASDAELEDALRRLGYAVR